MIAPGKYRAKAIDAFLTTSRTGSDCVEVLFQLTESKEELSWRGYFTEKSMPITLRGLRACGWRGDDVTDLSSVTSRECEVVVEQETDQQGRDWPRIRWVNEISGKRSSVRLDLKQAQAVADLVRKKIAAIESPADTEPGAIEGEDTPF